MNAEGFRALGFVLLAAAAAVGVALVGPRLLHTAGGPEGEIITALKEAEKEGLEIPLDGGQVLVASTVHYQRLQVLHDEAAGTATVRCTLDLQGKVGGTEVSSLGLERIPFRVQGGAWLPAEGLAPDLARALEALQARRAALESGDRRRLAALGAFRSDGGAPDQELERVLRVGQRRWRSLAWYLRAEREGVTVSEDYRLSGQTPERPVDERGTVRLLLNPGGEFLFPAGLM